jgi:hypothetical protein
MSARPTRSLTLRALVVGTAFTALALPAPASATWGHIDGNPRCPSGLRELKLDPVPQGTTTLTDGKLRVTVTTKGRYFSWSADQGVDLVLAKGGPMANPYRYSPEATSGSYLRPPINRSNGQPYGISHITFCYDLDRGVPPPPPAPGPVGAPTTKPDGTPCVPPPPPGPCEEGGPEMKPDGTPCVPVDAPQPPADTPQPPAGTPQPPARTPDPEPTPPAPREPVSTTIPSASSGVLGATTRVGRRVAARAALRGPSRCVRRTFTARIAGRGIRRVTVFVDGRRVKVLRGNRLRVRIAPKGRVTRVRARVEFVAASRRRPQTLSLTALRCAQQAVSPSFTG